MKNIIVVIILVVSIILFIKRIINILKGKKTCNCSSLDKERDCPLRNGCNKQNEIKK